MPEIEDRIRMVILKAYLASPRSADPVVAEAMILAALSKAGLAKGATAVVVNNDGVYAINTAAGDLAINRRDLSVDVSDWDFDPVDSPSEPGVFGYERYLEDTAA